jgi:hypothetical protein
VKTLTGQYATWRKIAILKPEATLGEIVHSPNAYRLVGGQLVTAPALDSKRPFGQARSSYDVAVGGIHAIADAFIGIRPPSIRSVYHPAGIVMVPAREEYG